MSSGDDVRDRGEGVTLTHPQRFARMMTLIEQATPDELRVLHLLGERLVRTGRKRYGAGLALAADARDFRREALEEAADLGLYASMALLRANGGAAS